MTVMVGIDSNSCLGLNLMVEAAGATVNGDEALAIGRTE